MESEAVTDARHISIKVFHSMISMPDENFEVRYADEGWFFYN